MHKRGHVCGVVGAAVRRFSVSVCVGFYRATMPKRFERRWYGTMFNEPVLRWGTMRAKRVRNQRDVCYKLLGISVFEQWTMSCYCEWWVYV